MEATQVADAQARSAIKGVSKLWWLWIVFGIAWIAVAAIILQFDDTSINTVGVIVGIMFLATGLQNFIVGMLADKLKWLWFLFGVLFLACGIVAISSPGDTFTALADALGFLFLVVGIFWLIQAFASRELNELWWTGLIAGILMLIIAFWTSGQFFIEKQYLLLVFAGIWALMQGLIDVIRAFQIKKLGELV